MDVTERVAPPPGSAAPGNLYADLQSRTLWLGVDPAVDPAAAVLVSDIIALLENDDEMLVNAKAYTDTQITTRAPTVHTHTASQITDFSAAVQAVLNSIPGFNWVPKTIMMFSGSLAEIGVGPLAGWSLCDGSNGTPDLRDKFILAAGNRAVGAVNPVATLLTDDQGSHIHVINGTAITVAQMAYHNHGSITGYISHDHAHNVNINTGGESADHVHFHAGGATTSTSGGNRPSGSGGTSQDATTGRNVAHYHNVSGGTSGVTQNHYHSIPAEGGNQAHTHTEQYAGIHKHNIASTALREAIPFYALAFIMKL